jgi:excisionase family DNA binding protein
MQPAQNDNQPPPLLLRVSAAARVLSISRSKAYGLCAAGILPSVRIGSSIRVSVQALERFVADLEKGND